jgi:hypothetical protein
MFNHRLALAPLLHFSSSVPLTPKSPPISLQIMLLMPCSSPDSLELSRQQRMQRLASRAPRVLARDHILPGLHFRHHFLLSHRARDDTAPTSRSVLVNKPPHLTVIVTLPFCSLAFACRCLKLFLVTVTNPPLSPHSPRNVNPLQTGPLMSSVDHTEPVLNNIWPDFVRLAIDCHLQSRWTHADQYLATGQHS